MHFPDDIKYHPEHTWVRVTGDTGIIGITNYAQEKLGEILYVDLPQAGDKVEKDRVFGAIESGKVSSDLYSPVSGEVIAVNEELEDSPELVNESPYDKGWLIKVKLSEPSELEKLLERREYLEKINI
ncbi:glycine cleavage system protein GcvH [Thermovenabulum sp.]|uniref:glycine cleavage system protein GcvH n=1 Tax=Thermovenabulum sp. TaxID=3100335 RepID=UPI003C7C17E6